MTERHPALICIARHLAVGKCATSVAVFRFLRKAAMVRHARSLAGAFVILSWAMLSFAQEGGSGMRLTSPEFKHNGLIPVKFTCQGDDINPPLAIEGAPPEAKTLALIVDDPDAPMGTWVHWVVFDIPPVDRIDAGSIPGRQGMNNFGRTRYGGPCPPFGTHRYFFKLYALDVKLGLPEQTTKEGLEKAMQGHILATAELIGLYKKGT
jgi:hypothetical protein